MWWFSLQDTAQDWVSRSIGAMGGRERLTSIRQVSLIGAGHENMVEQSERPSGPFITMYHRYQTTLNFEKPSFTEERKTQGIVFGSEREVGGKRTLEGAKLDQAAITRLILGPERVLLLAANDCRTTLLPDEVHQGVPHKVLQFKWGAQPVKLWLNSWTALPSAVETTGVLAEGFWPMWGDVAQRMSWSMWDLKNGVNFPLQWTREVNGYLLSDSTVLKLDIELGKPRRPAFLDPLPAPASRFGPMAERYREKEVVPGVTLYQGSFNTVSVDDGDGLTILDPVNDSAFTAAFLKRLPQKPVRAVVPTDDAWPHFGGARGYAAAGAKFYSLDLNTPILQKLLGAAYVSSPDAWAVKKKRASIHSFKAPMSLGKGANRMVLYPIRGEGSERMVMVYFPAHKLLYGTDLLQAQGEGFFFPQYARELADAVSREKISVETVFGQHLAPIPWKKVTDFVQKSQNPSLSVNP